MVFWHYKDSNLVMVVSIKKSKKSDQTVCKTLVPNWTKDGPSRVGFRLLSPVPNIGPVKVNQKMAVFGFEILGLKPKNFPGSELVLVWTQVKFCFEVWVWSLLSSLQLLTSNDRAQQVTKLNSDFSVIVD